MTKAEFVDRLARDGRIGSKKAAGETVEAVLDRITAALAAGDERQLHRLRQVQRRRAGAAPGRQSAHRRADHDRGRPRAEVLGRGWAEVQGEGLTAGRGACPQAARRQAPVSPAPFADRLAALVEERQSQLCLGLDPDPSRLDPGSAGGGGQCRRASRRGGRRALPLADRAGGPGLRRRQAPAGVLRAARRARLGGARAHRGRGARGRAAGDRGRQARRRAGQRRRLRAGAVRLDADALGRRRRPGGGRGDRQPA